MLKQVFSEYGTVTWSRVFDSGGKPNKAAIVEFADIEEAKWCVENLDGNIPEGLSTPIKVMFKRQGGGKGYNGGGKGGGSGFPSYGKASVGGGSSFVSSPYGKGPVGGGMGKGKVVRGKSGRQYPRGSQYAHQGHVQK